MLQASNNVNERHFVRSFAANARLEESSRTFEPEPDCSVALPLPLVAEPTDELLAPEGASRECDSEALMPPNSGILKPKRAFALSSAALRLRANRSVFISVTTLLLVRNGL